MVQATVISPGERLARARSRVETLRALVAHEMQPVNGTTRPEEILPQFEAAVADLVRMEATSGR